MEKIVQPRSNKVFFLSTNDEDRYLYKSVRKHAEWHPSDFPMAVYLKDKDATFYCKNDSFEPNEKVKYADGDQLERILLGGHYYVYVLLEPDTEKVFYVGKGCHDRALAHFIIGVTGNEVIESQEQQEPEKVRKIEELINRGYKRNDIVRIVAKQIDEETAFVIESFLIEHVYGLNELSNLVHGKYPNRYRNIGDWNYLNGFDLPFDGVIRDDVNYSYDNCQYYVYVIRNPATNQIIYVGKGTQRRALQHFIDAEKEFEGIGQSNKLQTLRDLRESHEINELVRIVAWVQEEASAYFLESFYIRFVAGPENLLNATSGHHLQKFRGKGDWEPRTGLDLVMLLKPGAPRAEMQDAFMSGGLGDLLEQVADKISECEFGKSLEFSEPKVIGAGELAIGAIVDGSIPIVVTIRNGRRYQVLLWCDNTSHKRYLAHKVDNFKLLSRRRDDTIFFPTAWHRIRKMTGSIDEAVRRFGLLVKFVRTESVEEFQSNDELWQLFSWERNALPEHISLVEETVAEVAKIPRFSNLNFSDIGYLNPGELEAVVELNDSILIAMTSSDTRGLQVILKAKNREQKEFLKLFSKTLGNNMPITKNRFIYPKNWIRPNMITNEPKEAAKRFALLFDKVLMVNKS